MPFRKKAKLIKPNATPEEVAEVTELLAERMLAILKIMIPIVIFLFVMVVVLEWQFQGRSKNVEKLSTSVDQVSVASQQSKESSDATLTLIRGILASTGPSSDNSIRTQKAVDAIFAIEQKVCGGPCPPATIPKPN